MEIAKSSPNGLKTLWEKEKLLVTSNFSFSHSVFKRLVLQTSENQGLCGKGLTQFQHFDGEPLSDKSVFTCLQSFENTVGGKREIACNEQFLFVPQCFLSFWRSFHHFHQIWSCHLQTLSVWKSLIFVMWERVRQ